MKAMLSHSKTYTRNSDKQQFVKWFAVMADRAIELAGLPEAVQLKLMDHISKRESAEGELEITFPEGSIVEPSMVAATEDTEEHQATWAKVPLYRAWGYAIDASQIRWIKRPDPTIVGL